ncbi:carbamoyltransferase family protein [Amycolatopsis minnesotensis]|uniref:Carbamoyltransferase n=1 Tax=Amycolatopsis minnesotensis TaxID=337894 RepID=A0ABN2QWB9_9PSEU
MLVLGLNGNFSTRDEDLVPGMLEFFFHDASASLVRDGVLLAAVEEERLNRIKKTTKFPVNAIQACFDAAGVTPAEVDAVGFYFPENHMDMVLNQLYTENPGTALRYSRQLIRERLHTEFGWDLPDERLVYTPHHLAHAMSSYTHSGMRDAVVAILDGRGEAHSGTIFLAADGKLETLATYPVQNSLGTWYLSATQLLGYKFGDEYKVMGLAPYGDPARYRTLFESLYSLGDEGGYELVPSIVGPNVFGPVFFEHGLRPRRKGEPFDRRHRDFAAALQETVETIALHVLRYWTGFTGVRNLCFGGGVAHNCSLNGEILRSGLFERVFVHPASHDSGAGEGAALAAGHRLGGTPLAGTRLRGADLGPGLGDDRQIAAKLKAWKALVEVVPATGSGGDDAIDTAARLLADGAVLGWARGRSEFGPRALGNRSIVADPRPKENQARINAMVKKRESFRPFAPVVTPTAAGTYFEIPDTGANYDFMSFVLRVREERRAELGAVTHVDGTARVQVVDPEVNEPFHRLVTRFGELTGTPVLLNTSFNNHAEPIVQSTEDVLTAFLTTELDYLVLENVVLRRRPDFLAALDTLIPRFRAVTRLERRVGFRSSGERRTWHEIALDYSTGPRASVSPELYALLEKTDGASSFAELGGALSDAVRQEIFALWAERYFTLSPA